ncbi:MAG: glycosyltransferase [Butyrivibrio sp.]|nr:glycosyltransferase [Butyrivibrio sp.]
MPKPFFSIMMVLDEYPGQFRRAVASCLEQSFSDWELLIPLSANEGPYNNMASYFAKADERVKIVSMPFGMTACEQLDLLLEEADGEYVSLLHSEDFWASSDSLKKVYDIAFSENPDMVIAGSDVVTEGDLPDFGKYEGTERVVHFTDEEKRDLNELFSPESLYEALCFIRKDYFRECKIGFVIPYGNVTDTLAVTGLKADKVCLFNDCIFAVDREGFRERQRIAETEQPFSKGKEPARKKIVYIWKDKDKKAPFFPPLIRKEAAILEGFVAPDGAVEYPANLTGYPVISASELARKEYDHIISFDEDVYSYVSDEEKVIFLGKIPEWISFLISPDAFYSKRRLRYDAVSKRAIDGIVTGMSYVQRAVIPQEMSFKILVAGEPSQDLYYDKSYLLKLYSAFGASVKYAVLGLAPYEFRYDESKSTSANARCLGYYDLYKRTHHYELDEAWLDEGLAMARKAESVLLDGYMDVLAETLRKTDFDYVRNIFEFESCSQEEKAASVEFVKKIADKPYRESIAENEAIFEDYLFFCKANGIKVVVLLPAFSSLFKTYFPREIVDELTEIVERMQKRYDFLFLNLYDDPDFDDKKHFADEDHLNVYGGMLMTQKLNEVLMKI